MMDETGQGPETASAGGHARAVAVGLCHPGQYLRARGARRLLIGLKPLQPRLELIWADGAYSGEPLATWCATEGAWRVEIITRAPHVQGFVVRPWCWIVERTLGWMGRQRRVSQDYGRQVQTSETLL